jgi:uncharacterized cupredoxin-like copper-binding protein
MSNVGKFLRALAVSALALTVAPSLASAEAGHAYPFGKPAKASQATRTVTITMQDSLFEPESISVKAGEVIRFVVINQGEFLHEFNIGTAEMHVEHQAEMLMMFEHGMMTATEMLDESEMDHSKMQGMDMSSMKHDDHNSILIEPGQTGELVWRFEKAMDLEFACNVPGHYEMGMTGPIQFVE